MKKLIIVRGGGDLATGTIHRLASAGFRVLVLETDAPAAIRRQVSFCEAIYEGRATVEGLTAVRISDASQAQQIWAEGNIPLLADPEGLCIRELKPAVVVDAILAKKNLGTYHGMAPCTVALGPGFCAGEDVDAVIETSRGHDLGRIIRKGTAKPNTGRPGNIGGYTVERVIHSSAAGTVHVLCGIGSVVDAGEQIAWVDTGKEKIPVHATIPGILRGMIRDGYKVTKGFKIADIDPRKEEIQNCFTISDKARCIAGSVLEVVCAAVNQEDDNAETV